MATKYRIVPWYGNRWAVEVFSEGSWDVVSVNIRIPSFLGSVPMTHAQSFSTILEAEDYILEQLGIKTADEMREAAHLATPPREYP